MTTTIEISIASNQLLQKYLSDFSHSSWPSIVNELINIGIKYVTRKEKKKS